MMIWWSTPLNLARTQMWSNNHWFTRPACYHWPMPVGYMCFCITDWNIQGTQSYTEQHYSCHFAWYVMLTKLFLFLSFTARKVHPCAPKWVIVSQLGLSCSSLAHKDTSVIVIFVRYIYSIKLLVHVAFHHHRVFVSDHWSASAPLSFWCISLTSERG